MVVMVGSVFHESMEPMQMMAAHVKLAVITHTQNNLKAIF